MTSAARGLAFTTENFVSFDGSTSAQQRLTRPDRYRHLEALRDDEARIVRGGGYSYVAASFGANATVQDFRAFDRVIALDERNGILECEAGATLGKIHALISRRGWYLPVQPGYPGITVGGCIAADVHGKNQFRDGTFRQHLRGLELFHPCHGRLRLDATHNAELFDITCGGLGLTGNILTAHLSLARLPSRRLILRKQRIRRLEDTLPLLDANASTATLIYTWHNFTAPAASFGRGFLYSATFVNDDQTSVAPENQSYAHIDARTRIRRGRALLRAATARSFNLAYEALQYCYPAKREVQLFDVMFPVAWKVAYFKFFGRPGFIECQIIIPREAFTYVARELCRYIVRFQPPITLASCKLFSGEQTFLRFDGNGVCLAVDLPRCAASDAFSHWLDALLIDVKGLPNIMKDSRLRPAVVAACYPEYEAFHERLYRFDPNRLYRSALSERLRL